MCALLNAAFCQCDQEQCNPHRFYLGLEFNKISIHENIDGIQVSGSNFFSGLHFGYEYIKPCSLYAGIDLFGVSSNHDFKGSVAWQKTDKGFGDIEFRLGYSFFSCPNLLASPFCGIGVYGIVPVDHYNDQGLKEDLPYVVGGIKFRYGLSNAFEIGLNGKVLRTFNTEQRFKLADETIKSYNNFWGGEIGVPLTWYIGCSKRWDFQFEPYYLRIANNIYGLRTLFGYHF
jgi:hypothetical protein